MHPIFLSVLQTIYPIPSPTLKRDRPLQVLALGLSRSGTDSLRQALLTLGYDNVYHGFVYGATPAHFLGWIQLGHAQRTGDKSRIRAEDFDRIIGNCAAVTDIPAAGFAHELLDAFPDAKIILNYREDVDAWHTSCTNTIETVCHLRTRRQWQDFVLSFFQAELFWLRRSFWWTWSRHFGGDFERNGRDWYREHYRSLEDRLAAGSYLKWKVEDGWQPLCEFLGKQIPQEDFPSGNVPEAFMKRIAATQSKWNRQAWRNVRIGLGVLASAIALLVGCRWWREGHGP